ncbi:DUF58 domain-containing protein [Marinobacter sp. F4206]|uniref:DUF58 domain-containing protein n=1 Tax=Marinobacter sp. F4206 TaxID=2861777 RepID=UPI001C5FFA18|nr:DUF58 domain-containing protein [Marinobacter sp. F4206]MBW4933341.1 DUF58 domain-containing protein [Marinobacter sp. F4206]
MKNPFKKRWSRWVNGRIPRTDVQMLNQKNIFILPTGAGVVFGVLLLVMLITGINYQNSLIYLTTFLLGAVFVGAMHQTHRNLSGLEITLVQPGEGVAGDEVPFRMRATAGRDHAIAIRLSCEGSEHSAAHISAGQATDLTLPVPSVHRGYLRPDRIRIETRFPFGLLKAWSWIRPASPGLVFPRPIAAPDVVSSVEDGNEAESASPADGNDHADLRPWREGDMSQRVMWKRYARSGQMVVADWEGERGSPQWLDFNAFPGTDHELRLSYLAWLVAERDRSGTPFGLSLPGQLIEPDSGASHVSRCLRALAIWGEERPREPVSARYGTRQPTESADARRTKGVV